MTTEAKEPRPRRCSRTAEHAEHSYFWGLVLYVCPGKTDGRRKPTVYYVVLVIAEDGTPSILGDKNGKPFRSDNGVSQEIADLYIADGMTAHVLLIESSEE